MSGSKPPTAVVHLGIATGLLLAGCGAHEAAAPRAPEVAATRVEPTLDPTVGNSPGQAEPVVRGGTEDYKSELVRLAMRGITYAGGVLAIDGELAATLVDGPDAEASAAALAAGRRLIALNHREEALAAMTRAVLLAPESPAAYEGLGDALTVRRKNIEAAAAFRAGLALAPASASLHHKLGDMLVRLNERAAAMAQFQRALELDPTHAEARERLALQLYYTGQPAAAWAEVHAAEALGRQVPPQFRALLARAHPEPAVQREEK